MRIRYLKTTINLDYVFKMIFNDEDYKIVLYFKNGDKKTLLYDEQSYNEIKSYMRWILIN